MKVQAVLFDLDGTLVDTLEDIRRCVNTSLREMGEGERTAEEVRSMIGDGLEALCRRALRRPGEGRVEELVRRCRGYYARRPVEASRPFPGVREMLERLHGAGLGLGILSNKPHELVEAVVDRVLDGGRFHVLLGAAPGRPRKPDPGGALEAARILGVSPGAVLLVGDSEMDVAAGKAAGMITAAAAWGYRDREVLAAAGPDYLLSAPSEIPDRVLVPR